MEHNPSWEANKSAATQEIPPHFMETESSLPHSQQPTTCPYPEIPGDIIYLYISSHITGMGITMLVSLTNIMTKREVVKVFLQDLFSKSTSFHTRHFWLYHSTP